MFQLASAFLSLSTHAPDTGSGSCEQFFAIKIFCSWPSRTKEKEGQKVTEQLTSSIFPLQRKTLETRQQSAKMHRDADGWMRVSHSNWLCSLSLFLFLSLSPSYPYSLSLSLSLPGPTRGCFWSERERWLPWLSKHWAESGMRKRQRRWESERVEEREREREYGNLEINRAALVAGRGQVWWLECQSDEWAATLWSLMNKSACEAIFDARWGRFWHFSGGRMGPNCGSLTQLSSTHYLPPEHLFNICPLEAFYLGPSRSSLSLSLSLLSLASMMLLRREGKKRVKWKKDRQEGHKMNSSKSLRGDEERAREEEREEEREGGWVQRWADVMCVKQKRSSWVK